MALIVVKETGPGSANANSYASVADADAYHEAHLYASAWTSASQATKEAALVMATRLIDGCYQFNGRKVSSAQALQWPRAKAIDPDGPNNTELFGVSGRYFPEDAVPVAVVNATCEVARELIKADSTDATDAEGLQSISIAGALNLTFDKRDQQPKISDTAQAFLAKLGTYLPGRSGVVRLVRV
jgi:hypothetical protein